MRRRRRFHGWRARLALAMFGMMFAFVVGEVGLRLLGVSLHVPYVPDDQVGTVLQPGWSGWQTKEGRARLRINSLGFRDIEHSREKPDGVVRIAVLGDSYVEAAQVDLADTFWRRLERELNERHAFGERRVEVMAFGVSGWGTGQELLALRHYALEFSPDHVLVAFLPANDIRNNSAALEPESIRPYFSLDDSGELKLDDSYLESPLAIRARSPWTRVKVRLLNASRVLQVVQAAKRQWTYGAEEVEPKRNEAQDADGDPDHQVAADHESLPTGSAKRSSESASPAPLEAGLDNAFYFEPPDDRWSEAWEVTERLLVAIDRESEAAGAQCRILVLTAAAQIDPDTAARGQLARRLRVDDLDYAARRIESLGEREGIRVINLVPPMRSHAELHAVHLHGFPNSGLGAGHWNETGHEVAAREIAAALTADQ